MRDKIKDLSVWKRADARLYPQQQQYFFFLFVIAQCTRRLYIVYYGHKKQKNKTRQEK